MTTAELRKNPLKTSFVADFNMRRSQIEEEEQQQRRSLTLIAKKAEFVFVLFIYDFSQFSCLHKTPSKARFEYFRFWLSKSKNQK